MSARATERFSHVLTLSDGSRHGVFADGRNIHGVRLPGARAIRPIEQPDGTWPSLTKREAA